MFQVFALGRGFLFWVSIGDVWSLLKTIEHYGSRLSRFIPMTSSNFVAQTTSLDGELK